MMGQENDEAAAPADNRSEVVGGSHLNGFVSIFRELAAEAGFEEGEHMRLNKGGEIPGYFRATKDWDILVHRSGRLCAALELKSQAGPSFGNNFNNRSEEAIGSALDLRLVAERGALGPQMPFVGYLFLLEDAPGANRPVRITSELFPPLGEFAGASYWRRYELLLSRYVEQRLYTAAALLKAPRGTAGQYTQSEKLPIKPFLEAYYAHLLACA